MFLLSNFILASAQLVDIVLTIAYWLILIRAIVSWVSPDPFNPIVQFLYRTTDPILQPIQSLLPRVGGIDISPFIAFLLIIFFKSFLVRSLIDFGLRLRT